MPVVDRLPVPVIGREIPPRRPAPRPPDHPVDHQPVIGPTTTPPRASVGQQRLQSSPFLIGQIMAIQHDQDLPHPKATIHGTRSSARRRRSELDRLLRPARMRCLGRSQVCPWALNDARRALPQGVSASDVVHLALHRRRDGALSPGTPSITRTSAATRTRSSSVGMPPRAPLSRWERPIGWPSAIAAR